MLKLTTLITEPSHYSPKAIAVYKRYGPVYLLPDLKGKQKEKVMKAANILVVRLGNYIDKGWLAKMPNLKIIATNTTGLNHIDLSLMQEKGVKIVSLRGRTSFLKHIPSTAELTMGLMFAVVRKIPWAFDSVRKGDWDRDSFRGSQFAGRTFGILGYGRLGKLVAKYAKTFGMNVIAHDPHVADASMARRGVKSVSMNNLFKNSDILSLHVLLTDATENLVDESHLKLMKPTAYLLNTARAEIVSKPAIHMALKNNWIAGAAIDVMWDEDAGGKHLKNDPLWRYATKNDNLLIVPHIGGASFDAMQITEEFIADLVVAYIAKKKLA